MLGTGLGRTTLYMRGVPGPLEVSDTAAGVWPSVVAIMAAISGI